MTSTEILLRDLCRQKGVNYVGTRGDVTSPICMIGEAPGSDEDQAGLPFIGKSGQELDRMALEAGLPPSTYWLTNPYKVRPPENEIDRINEVGIDLNLFIKQFIEELYEHKPTLIVTAGNTPLATLCPETRSKRDGKAKIGQWRGSLLRSSLLNWDHYIIPMYHPAYILREWSERQVSVLCLARVAEELAYYQAHKNLQPLPERHLLINPASADAIIEYLAAILRSPEAVSIDIEMIAEKRRHPTNPKKYITVYKIPRCVAIARSPYDAISFSFWNYDTRKLAIIWKMFNEILKTKPQIGQNYLGFDCHWFDYLGFEPNPFRVDDTMVRHHTLWPELEHKLQFQTFQYTREPYYKDEGRMWKPSDGLDRLMRYNAKDAAVTYEIFLQQEKEFSDRPYLREFHNNVAMRRARHLFNVEKRGILVDRKKLAELETYIDSELRKACDVIEKYAAKRVVTSKDEADRLGVDCLNLASSKQVIEFVKSLGVKVYTSRSTGNESVGKEFLHRMAAASGHEAIKQMIIVSEYQKMKSTYCHAKLEKNCLFTNFVPTGTVTGRLSSRETVFGYGTNLQNIPKHSALGKKFRECLIARPGKLLVEVDQSLAEDWVVQGIISDILGSAGPLEPLRKKVDRHRKLASIIFGKPEADCGKGTIERFLGKKTRHAGNYDMHEETMSEALAKEGFIIPIEACAFFLLKFHEAEPNIKAVYHQYIQNQLNTKRSLRSPFGRERVFFGLRPWSNNNEQYRQGYSTIPQATVSDNNGLATSFIEEESPGLVLLDGHDALFLEIEDDLESLIKTSDLLQRAYKRDIKFPNGTIINIPIDMSIGYDLKNMKECEDLTNLGLKATWTSLKESQNRQEIITTGPPLQSSQQVSNATSGLIE